MTRYSKRNEKLNAYTESQSILNSELNELDSNSEDPTELIQRCLIIKKDHKGYGLTVSGDNPVYVQSVRKDGAADRAGVFEGDRIIKVNGKLVTHANHLEVVRLIKAASYVALTVLGRPPSIRRTKHLPPSQPNHSRHAGTSSTARHLDGDRNHRRHHQVAISATTSRTTPCPTPPVQSQLITTLPPGITFTGTTITTLSGGPPPSYTNSQQQHVQGTPQLSRYSEQSTHLSKFGDPTNSLHNLAFLHSLTTSKPAKVAETFISHVPFDKFVPSSLSKGTTKKTLKQPSSKIPNHLQQFVRLDESLINKDPFSGADAIQLGAKQKVIYEKIVTLKKLFNQEAIVLRNLQKQYLYNPSYKLKQEINGVTRRLASLNQNISLLNDQLMLAAAPASATTDSYITKFGPASLQNRTTQQQSYPVLPARHVSRVSSFEENDALDTLRRSSLNHTNHDKNIPNASTDISNTFTSAGTTPFKRQNTVVCGSLLATPAVDHFDNIDSDNTGLEEDLYADIYDHVQLPTKAVSRDDYALNVADVNAGKNTYITHDKSAVGHSRDDTSLIGLHRRSTGSVSSLLDQNHLPAVMEVADELSNTSGNDPDQISSPPITGTNLLDRLPTTIDTFYFKSPGGQHQSLGGEDSGQSNSHLPREGTLPLQDFDEEDLAANNSGSNQLTSGDSMERINALYEPFQQPLLPSNQPKREGLKHSPRSFDQYQQDGEHFGRPPGLEDWPTANINHLPAQSSKLNFPRRVVTTTENASISTMSHAAPLGNREFSLEDDYASEDDDNFESHGPYNDIHSLKGYPAHLAVFLNYLFCNSDPNSLLFYLITEYYVNQASHNVKDVKRWAYEIHSSFIVPHAPLKVHVPEHVIVKIDDVLQNEEVAPSSNNSFAFESTKWIFKQARSYIMTDIREKLADFRLKRSLGLSSIYGDSAIDESICNDRNKAKKMAEQIMYGIVEKLARYWSSTPSGPEDLNNQSECVRDRDSLLLCATLTVCRTTMGLNLKSATVYLYTTNNAEGYNSLNNLSSGQQQIQITLDKIPIFCAPSKENHGLFFPTGSGPSRFKFSSKALSAATGGGGAPKLVTYIGHVFLPMRYTKLTFCTRCHEIIGGLGYQGLQCQNCQYNTHRVCLDAIDESCLLVPQSNNNSALAPLTSSNPLPQLNQAIQHSTPAVQLRRSGAGQQDANSNLSGTKTGSFVSNIMRRRETKSMFMGSPPPQSHQYPAFANENIPEELDTNISPEHVKQQNNLLGTNEVKQSKKSLSAFTRSPLKSQSSFKSALAEPSSLMPAPALESSSTGHSQNTTSSSGIIPTFSNKWFTNLTGGNTNTNNTHKDLANAMLSNTIVASKEGAQTSLNERQRKSSGSIGMAEKIGASLSGMGFKGSANVNHQHHQGVFRHATNASSTSSSAASTNVGRSESMKAKGENKYPRKKNDSNVPRSKSDIAPKALSTEQVVEDIEPPKPVTLQPKKPSIEWSLANHLHHYTHSKSSPLFDDGPSGNKNKTPFSNALHKSGISTANLASSASFQTSSTLTSAAANAAFTNTATSTSSLLKYVDLLNTSGLLEKDSDLNTEPTVPDWQSSVEWDTLKKMKPKEVMRQDVINELFHTERNHVRNLKVLDYIFYRPMKLEHLVPEETLQKLFPNLDQLLKIHGDLNEKMKAMKAQCPIVDSVGPMLLNFFGHHSGKTLQEACATFCKHQPYVLELLKLKSRKDSKLAAFLAEAESNPLCRRLQLKDLLPCQMQRLTKYPLLIENIMKYTTSTESREYQDLNASYECARTILAHVNESIRETQNYRRLLEIESKLDKIALERAYEKAHDIARLAEIKALKLSNKKLIMEGPLQWKCGRNKNIDVYALLLDDFLLITQKQDDRFVLKFHSTNLGATTREDPAGKVQLLSHSPVIRLNNLLTKNVATDKRAFFVVSTVSEGPQLYELIASTSNERKQWLTHIERSVERLKYGSSATAFGGLFPPPSTLTGLSHSTSNTDIMHHPSSSNSDAPRAVGINVPNKNGPGLILNGGIGANVGSTPNGGSVTPVRHASDPTSKSGSTSPGQYHHSQKRMSKDDSMTDLETNIYNFGRHKLNQDAPPIGAATVTATRELIQMVQEEQQNQVEEGQFEMIEYIKTPQIVQPSEIKIREPIPSRKAEPILTLYEQLRRADRMVQRALTEKRIVSQRILESMVAASTSSSRYNTKITPNSLLAPSNKKGSRSSSHQSRADDSSLIVTDPTTGARIRSPSPRPSTLPTSLMATNLANLLQASSPLAINTGNARTPYSHSAEGPQEILVKAYEQSRALAIALAKFEESHANLIMSKGDGQFDKPEKLVTGTISKEMKNSHDGSVSVDGDVLPQGGDSNNIVDQQKNDEDSLKNGSSLLTNQLLNIDQVKHALSLVDLKDNILLISTAINFELSRLFNTLVGIPVSTASTINELPTFFSTSPNLPSDTPPSPELTPSGSFNLRGLNQLSDVPTTLISIPNDASATTKQNKQLFDGNQTPDVGASILAINSDQGLLPDGTTPSINTKEYLKVERSEIVRITGDCNESLKSPKQTRRPITKPLDEYNEGFAHADQPLNFELLTISGATSNPPNTPSNANDSSQTALPHSEIAKCQNDDPNSETCHNLIIDFNRSLSNAGEQLHPASVVERAEVEFIEEVTNTCSLVHFETKTVNSSVSST